MECLVDLPRPLRNEIEPLASWQASRFGRLAAGRRLSASASSEQDPHPPPTGLHIAPSDEVDYVVKPTAGTGSNAASGNGDSQVCFAGACAAASVAIVSLAG